MDQLRFQSIGIDRLRMATDGEGVTTLVAGFGCPLRCKYCLNPQCFERDLPVKTYSVQELLDEVAIDDLYFQATGGGVVFGGGEPLLQADFIHAFKERAPKEWRLYLESSLSVPTQQLEKVIADIDFFLIDIKDMDPEIYRAYTGRDSLMLLQNLDLLVQHEKTAITKIRIPLIPKYNDQGHRQFSIEQLRAMGFTDFDLFEYNIPRALEKRRTSGGTHFSSSDH